MTEEDNYSEERTCIFNGEEYSVRDNGAVLRKIPSGRKKPRKLDNIWTYGKVNKRTGYLEIASVRVHRIVATAFHGEAPTPEHVVDHIDTNKQNNRPSNLRWLTRLENILVNEITRHKIEYVLGVSIFEFLNNPSAYRDKLNSSDYNWMRRVTDEEAKNCLNNWKNLIKRKPLIKRHKTSGVDERIFSIEYSYDTFDNDEPEIIDSLTPGAKQKDWKTPTEFLCCPKPEEIEGEPIACYFKKLSKKALFQRNKYKDSVIVNFALTEKNSILVITFSYEEDVKMFALAEITFEDGSYIHTNLDTYFTGKGVKKQFVLRQGQKWNGGNNLDDYCH